MKINLSYLIPLTLVIILFSSCSTNKSKENNSAIKFHPGHYVAVGPGPTYELAQIKYLNDPAVKGVNKRYFWQMIVRRSINLDR